jgi:NAD(P)-dependent dehydrogenase (short-subunit alcohol dehydrogenase family)
VSAATTSMPDSQRLAAWVTGASRGLGRAIAVGLASNGWRVAITARSSEGIRKVASEISSSGGEALVLPADVTDPDSLRAAATEIRNAWDGLDACITAAGISPIRKPGDEISDQEWREILCSNLDGTFWSIREAARLMLAAGRPGSIIAISSVHGQVGARGLAAYSASKGAIDALVRSLAADWALSGIRVNVLAPGYFSTDMTEGVRRSERSRSALLDRILLNRFGEASELVPAVLFLASPDSSYVTGSTLVVDGGWTTM